jgi:hypothetical protein
MTIERKLGYSKSREQGVGFVNAVRGERKWVVVPPGSAVARDGSGWRTVDNNTLEFGETARPSTGTMYGIMVVTRYTKDKINTNCRNFRWTPDDDSAEGNNGEVSTYESNF